MVESPKSLRGPSSCDLCNTRAKTPLVDVRIYPCGHQIRHNCCALSPVPRICPICDESVLTSKSEQVYAEEERAMENTKLRRGKWTEAEDAFASEFIKAFLRGKLRLSDGMPLRRILARFLKCSPMRISKHYKGKEAIGKYVYHHRKVDVECLRQLAALEQAFRDDCQVREKQGPKKPRPEERLERDPLDAPATVSTMLLDECQEMEIPDEKLLKS